MDTDNLSLGTSENLSFVLKKPAPRDKRFILLSEEVSKTRDGVLSVFDELLLGLIPDVL